MVAVAAAVGAACGGDGTPAATGPSLSGEAAAGRSVAKANGCLSCHTDDGGDGVGPTFLGLAGSEVELEDGSTVTADRDYLRRSILEPNAQIVAGFRPIMPQRRLPEGDVDAIIAYLEAIGSSSGKDTSGTGSSG